MIFSFKFSTFGLHLHTNGVFGLGRRFERMNLHCVWIGGGTVPPDGWGVPPPFGSTDGGGWGWVESWPKWGTFDKWRERRACGSESYVWSLQSHFCPLVLCFILDVHVMAFQQRGGSMHAQWCEQTFQQRAWDSWLQESLWPTSMRNGCIVKLVREWMNRNKEWCTII